jgi:Chitobiase/beta-hexosaminidase C-terminal domain/Carboxypeptidase regulatory-like domain
MANPSFVQIAGTIPSPDFAGVGTSANPMQAVFANNTAGNTLVAIVGTFPTTNTIPSPTDSIAGGNTWVAAGAAIVGNEKVQIFYALNIKGGPNTVSMAITGNSFAYFTVAEYASGNALPLLFDAFSQQAHSTPNPFVSPNIVTAINNELLVGLGGCEAGAHFFTSNTAGWTKRNTDGTGQSGLIIQDAIAATAGTQFSSYDVSGVLTQSLTAAVIAFKQTPTFTISGTILDGSSNPISGVTVSCTGQSNTTTDGSGNYSFPNLVAGTYTITPTKIGWTFAPTSVSPTISSDTTENFTGTHLTVATPTFSPVAGTYSSTQSVTVSDTDSGLAGFAMYYTTDGSTPTTGSTLYAGAITVSSSETVKVLAVATGYINSAIGSAAYIITSPSTGSGSGLGFDFRFRF